MKQPTDFLSDLAIYSKQVPEYIADLHNVDATKDELHTLHWLLSNMNKRPYQFMSNVHGSIGHSRKAQLAVLDKPIGEVAA